MNSPPNYDYASVTQALSPFVDFSMVPPAALAEAAERGSRVHAFCTAYALGLWSPKLPPHETRYFDSFKSWFDRYVDKVLFAEIEVVDHTHKYKGHPDLGVIIRGDDFGTVIDMKTPIAKSPVWRSQIAAYVHATDPKYNIRRGSSLRLRPSGAIALADPYDYHDSDFAAFLNALYAYRYFKKGVA